MPLDSISRHAIRRFRDVCRERHGVLPAELAMKHYAAAVLANAEKREEARREIRTREAWEKERERTREALLNAIGPLPSFEPEVVAKGVIEKETVAIRKTLFSTIRGNEVPANIYLPKRAAGPLPGIVNLCGHGALGKAGYAERCMAIAARGYAVIAFDLIGMGERQLVPLDAATYCVSTQHNILGSKMVLAGRNPLWFMIQEAIGAVSVLAGLPEVDGERIGVTGASGGGMLSVFAAALDERIKAIAPAASVHSQRYNAYPDDAEQALFDMIAEGLDYPDILGFLLAPRPLFVVANTRDIWGIEGTQYACDEAARLYEMLGHKDRIRMKRWDKGHAYESDQFAEARGWFDRWLENDAGPSPRPGPAADGVPSAKELSVSPHENIYLDGCKAPGRVFRESVEQDIAAKKDMEGFLDFLKKTTAPSSETHWEELDRFVVGKIMGRRIHYVPEPGILLPVEVLIPSGPRGVIVLLDECDRREDIEWQIRRASEGLVALRPDLRGWGETQPEEDYADREGWSRNLYDDRRQKLCALAQLAGRNLVMDRVRDVRALLNVAEALAPGKEIRIEGRRQGAWVALLAGLADARVKKLAIERFLYSFRDVLRHEVPVYRCEGAVHGFLRWGVDVADLLDRFEGELKSVRPVDGLMRPL